jgi:hypothetical protein
MRVYKLVTAINNTDGFSRLNPRLLIKQYYLFWLLSLNKTIMSVKPLNNWLFYAGTAVLWNSDNNGVLKIRLGCHHLYVQITEHWWYFTWQVHFEHCALADTLAAHVWPEKYVTVLKIKSYKLHNSVASDRLYYISSLYVLDFIITRSGAEYFFS